MQVSALWNYSRAASIKIVFPHVINLFPYFVNADIGISSRIAVLTTTISIIMVSKPTMSNTMRIYHRYLGYFLAGIMAIYAISGVIMIFRDTNFLKRDEQMEKKLAANLTEKELGEAIRVRDLKITSQNGDVASFANGTYNKVTGVANYTIKVWPEFINKLTGLHKASSKQPLFYLNVFFGVSLLFFVVSAFWMFLPKTSIFKKGLYFTLAGMILTLILLFI